MYRLIYTSACREGLTLDILEEIAEASAPANAARGITGILLCHDGLILQVIEGPEAEVRSLYHSISQDDRHGGCTVLLACECEGREFSSWSMGFVKVDEDDVDHFRLTLSALKARQRARLISRPRRADAVRIAS